MKRESYDGQQFGRLTVLCDIQRRPRKGGFLRVVLARCSCDGGIQSYALQSLQTDKTQSCGCWRREASRIAHTTHGYSDTAEYSVWCSMKDRCYNPGASHWEYYGARGITVCKRWRDSFENFLADMGPRPSKKHSIERRNTDLGYSPKNCCWTTHTEQMRNTRRNHQITFNGETLCVSEWAERLGITNSSLLERLEKWPLDKALSRGKVLPTERDGHRLITHKGVTLTMKRWAERVGIKYSTLETRLRRGWDVGRALGH